MSYVSKLPKMNLKAISSEINRIASETSFLKKWVREYSSQSFSYRTTHEEEFKEKNARLIALKQRTTVLCSLAAHCHYKVHLLDVFSAFVESTSTVSRLTGVDYNIEKDSFVDRMLDLQERMLFDSGIVYEFALSHNMLMANIDNKPV
jgi:hypothetical protein